jgi:DNA repair protein RecN (Recombination protein N)
MLSELLIRDFAIIDELHLRFDPGFNVLTGETGTGKSIILDAVTLVLGDRADISMIRAGSSKAYVEASFDLNPIAREKLRSVLVEQGLDDEDERQLVIARELRSNGRTVSRVNGSAVNLGLLRRISEPLIDIHGQGEHLSLLKPQSHLPILDAYAGLAGQRRTLSDAVASLRSLQRELKTLRESERARAQRIDMLKFQIQEIAATNLEAGEEEALREERARLSNVEQLLQLAGQATALSVGHEDDSSGSVSDSLSELERLVSQMARFDESQATLVETVQGLSYQFGEVAAQIQDYLHELEFNPGRLDYVEERLEAIAGLKRKYGDDISKVLEWKDQATRELEQISGSEQRIVELSASEERMLREIGRQAMRLSTARKAAAATLSSSVESQLADLRMEGTSFAIDFKFEPAIDGLYVAEDESEKRYAFDSSGMDHVQFLISTNPGEPLKPMARIASGGETSRLMLALKSALAQADSAPTLIFDEIDQGIGGRVGDVAGRKLWALTTETKHQVIVVTHLPQIAGYGDAHFRVKKQTDDGRTVTSVLPLDESGRVQELAAMLGTLGEHATGGAESILAQVATAKRRH